jgi:hypothetical protein
MDHTVVRRDPAPGLRLVSGVPAADVAADARRGGRRVLHAELGHDPIQHDHVNLCAIMLVPFFMTIVVQIKRMALPSHLLAYCYLCGIAGGATLFAIADIFWLIAAFRPDRNPQLILLLNDMAWLIFTAPVGMVVVANLCLALAIFLDARAEPIFPRWVAYFNIATAVAMTPAACAVIFATGPLAWDGAVSFWLRIGAFSLNIAVMFIVLRSAINRQATEEAPEDELPQDTSAQKVAQ